MYSIKEAAATKKKFWTLFGYYMVPVPSASGEHINWINYKTGIKEISIKTDVGIHRCSVSIEIYSTDIMLQHHYFDLLCNFTKDHSEFLKANDYMKRAKKTNGILFMQN